MASRAKCGCYDGPYTKGSKILVSVRCHQHAKTPPMHGHSLMVLDESGKVVKTTPRDKLDGYQASTLKEIKQRKLYG